MLVEKYSSAFPTNILTPEDVLVDVSHQQLMLRSSNRDTGRYDVQEKVEEGSLVDASDTSPEDDVNTEYNWISETFFRKSYADEESVGTEQLAEQASLQAGEDNFSLTEEDLFSKGGGESSTSSRDAEDIDASGPPSNSDDSSGAVTTSNITDTNVECVPLAVVQSATSIGNNCLKFLTIIILRSMNLFFLESVDEAMEVDVCPSVTPSSTSASLRAVAASIIPNIDDESTLSEVFQSASDVAKYGDLSISALKEFPGVKLELINKIPKQNYCLFVATSKLAKEIFAQSEELGAFSAELIIEPGSLLEYIDLIPDQNFKSDSVITMANKQEYYIYCKQRRIYYNGFDNTKGCGAYFLAYANDPLGVKEPNVYLSYDSTKGRLGLYNSKCIRPGMELFWEYDSSGKYWRGRDIYLNSEVWKRVVMKYPSVVRRNRRRIGEEDDDDFVVDSTKPSRSSPVKRRRLHLVSSSKPTEVINSPLFARSKFTTKDILECQLLSDLREIKAGI